MFYNNKGLIHQKFIIISMNVPSNRFKIHEAKTDRTKGRKRKTFIIINFKILSIRQKILRTEKSSANILY